MKKKVFSLALIAVLISFTVAPLWGYSCISYGADSTTATDEQKQDAALSTYFNYRGGYFVASSGGAGVALQMARNYITEFYLSDSNTTGINSTSDFLAHVTFRNTNDHWGIYIDNNGVVFLDHLVKYILGKDEFPELYSGGSWGEGDTVDEIYRGFRYGGKIVWFVKEGGNSTIFSTSLDNVEQGNSTDLDGQDLYNLLKNKYPDMKVLHNSGNQSPDYPVIPQTGTFTVDFLSGNTVDLSYYMTATTDSRHQYKDPFTPYVTLYNRSIGNNNSYAGAACSILYCENGIKSVRGYPCVYMLSGNNTTLYYGYMCVNYTDSIVACEKLGQHIVDNDITETNVNFETFQFDRNDVGSESGTAPGVEFTPKEQGENNVYNYYNYNDYSEKQFIENYIEKYVKKKTIIDGSSQDPGDNPGGGGGGSVTPGSGSGSITPDGNGGYNFDLPDIGWPDFSGFDFNISGLSQKFPFSIPFDLMAFFTVLNAEPETPEIQGDIDLGIVNWEIDWDLHDFDTLASLLRNLEFIGFCISLILITRSIIKG